MALNVLQHLANRSSCYSGKHRPDARRTKISAFWERTSHEIKRISCFLKHCLFLPPPLVSGLGKHHVDGYENRNPLWSTSFLLIFLGTVDDQCIGFFQFRLTLLTYFPHFDSNLRRTILTRERRSVEPKCLSRVVCMCMI